MKIAFTKMSGAGNDFIFLAPEYTALKPLLSGLAKVLCRRRASIGADGLVLVERMRDQIGGGIGGEILMHYFNSDGSRASFCGNGARCLVRYCVEKGIAESPVMFRSDSGRHSGEITERGVRIGMEAPVLRRRLEIRVSDRSRQVYLVDAGVPHAVILSEGIDSMDVEATGRMIRNDPAFRPEGANVDFVDSAGPPFRVRTYERGVEGETLACGSGCVAAALALNLAGLAGASVNLMVASGDVLTVDLGGTPPASPTSRGPEAHLTGPAVIAFEGQVEIKENTDV